MAPKNRDDAIKKTRRRIFSQKISASKNGKPTCAEKNKSPPGVNFARRSDSMTSWEGNGPMWVKLIKMDLISTNKAVLLNTNGIRFGSKTQSKAMKIQRIIAP